MQISGNLSFGRDLSALDWMLTWFNALNADAGGQLAGSTQNSFTITEDDAEILFPAIPGGEPGGSSVRLVGTGIGFSGGTQISAVGTISAFEVTAMVGGITLTTTLTFAEAVSLQSILDLTTLANNPSNSIEDYPDLEDLLLPSGVSVVQVGTDGVDRITGLSTDDDLSGLGGRDLILGFGGDDSMSGGGGRDSMLGARGDDTLLGGGGNDTLLGDEGADSLVGGGGDDLMNAGNGHDFLSGGAGNDGLDGERGNDTLRGGSGNDRADGDAGDDELFGNSGDDTLNGGAGDDTLRGGSGADTFDGNQGNDLIEGGGGADYIVGGSGRDTLLGGNGRDTLVSDRGNDILDGGAGADEFRFFALSANHDIVRGFETDLDVLIINGVTALSDMTFTDVGDDVVITFNDQTITVRDTTAVDLQFDEIFGL